jgi:peptidyl-prolyl cis-trans isomerase B (cyclophilin B)
MIDAEFTLTHQRGSIAAARMGDHVNPQKKSNGSQFYICIRSLPQLDKMGYSVFGKVVSGMETVDKIGRLKIDARQKPNRRVVIERIYVD